MYSVPFLCQRASKVVGVAGFEPATPSSRTSIPYRKTTKNNDAIVVQSVNTAGTLGYLCAETVPAPCAARRVRDESECGRFSKEKTPVGAKE